MSLPKYIKPSMTLEQAARQAHLRGRLLVLRWNGTSGLTVKELDKMPTGIKSQA